jgi:hypothetical protein
VSITPKKSRQQGDASGAKKKPNANQLSHVRGLDLIPLHTWNAKRKRHGRVREMGKAPVDPGWTTLRYDSDKIMARALKQGHNVGVRLSSDMVVVDVDPKNGGKIGFANLCADLGLNFDDAPHVITGSGGDHYYLGLPPDTLVLDTLQNEKYAGVEFKSKGRQVVAPGCIHPNGNMYKVADDSPTDFINLPDVPDDLLLMVKRPPRSVNTAGGGQISNEQLTAMLNKLDAEDYGTNDTWFPILCACHHATAGEGRQEFIDWSTSAPGFENADYEVGSRWDSLHKEKNNGFTVATLNRELRLHGATSAQAANVVEDDDFPNDEPPKVPAKSNDDSWLNGEPSSDDAWLNGDGEDDDIPVVNDWPEDSVSKLEKLNEQFCGVSAHGKYRIMTLQDSEGGKRWSMFSRQDFIATYENTRIERDMEGLSRNAANTTTLGEAWQTWPKRKSANGTCFDTTKPAGEIVNGLLNLWTGFAVEPVEGKWSRFEAMIRDDICAGNDEVFEYALNWIAWKFQNPGEVPGTSIAFRGGKGAGKTTLGETIVDIFGQHGQAASAIDDIIGRFNATRETKCFIYADEVVWGGDLKSEGELKKLITDKLADYEGKGTPSFQGVNHVGLMIGGNDKWVVPASMDERRFCATTVSTKHFAPPDAKKDNPNRQYWNRVHREIANGGRAAFLFDMLKRDVKGWHPREGVPQTEAMGEQKLHGFKGINKWWFECLRDGALPLEAIIADKDSSAWEKQALALKPNEVVKAFAEWTARQNVHINVTYNAVLEGLRAWGVEGGEGQKFKQVRCWKVSKLSAAREILAEKLGFDPFKG